ncbi:unnamed protein product, partial [Prorocentrum cordatum]
PPSPGSRPGSRGAAAGQAGSRPPSGQAGSRPPSRGASPMRLPGSPPPRESVPAVQRSPSGSSLGAALYRRGDLVEYHSSSHKEWLPAVVNSVNDAGDIVIDLKPNTWIPRQELSGKIRRRRKASLPGAGGYASGAPPARAPSPRRDVAAGRPRVPLARAPSPLRCGGMAVVGS